MVGLLGREEPPELFFCSDNSGTICVAFPYAGIFTQTGFNVLLFNNQRLGQAAGVPYGVSLIDDVEAAYAYLIDQGKIDPEQIAINGISLGSTLAFYLAAQHPVRAVAVEDVFLPNEMIDVFFARSDPNPLLTFAVKATRGTLAATVATESNVPILFMHGVKE